VSRQIMAEVKPSLYPFYVHTTLHRDGLTWYRKHILHTLLIAPSKLALLEGCTITLHESQYETTKQYLEQMVAFDCYFIDQKIY
jgi:hypothetical protein